MHNLDKRVRGLSGRGLVSLGVLALTSSLLPLGCGDDPAPGGTSAGGKAGSGGKGGSAGSTGGDSGAAGGSGKGAGGKGASGGTAGTGGSGGSAGKASGGAAGSSGNGGGGAGGSSAAGGSAGIEDGGEGGHPMGGEGGEGGAAPVHDEFFDAAEWAIIQTLAPLGAVPPDPTNAYADNAAAAALGQKFFFEKDFAGALADLGTGVVNDLGAAGETGKVACASCHFTSVMMSDHRSNPTNVSLGANFHSRNAPGMVNSSFYPWTNWGGRFSRQWELPMPVTESGAILNSSRLRVAHVIFDQYRSDYEAVFGAAYGPMEPAIGSDPNRFPATGKPKPDQTAADGVWELQVSAADRAIVNRIFVNYAKALAAYTRTLVSRNSALDRYVAGAFETLTLSEKRGLELFIADNVGCVNCHGGAHLSDGGFHNIGVAQTGAHVPAMDDGRFKDIPPLIASTLNAASATWSDDPVAGAALITPLNPADEANRAAFRTPSLRGVSDTAPYMHSGQLATLADVVEFYSRGGDTPAAGTKVITALNLTTEQKADLVAFLMTLTGDPVSQGLRADTSQ